MKASDSTRYLDDVFDQLNLSRFLSRDEFLQGARQLEAALLRVGLDAHLAVVGSIPFMRAVDDDVRFPFLSDLHNRITDCLLMDVPDELVVFVEHLRNLPDPPIAEEIRKWLVARALDSTESEVQRALAEFLLFEAVRVNLSVAAQDADGELERVGSGLGDLDAIAERTVRDLLVAGPLEDDVRPFHVLMAGAMVRLRDHATRLRALLRTTGDALANVWAERASVARALRDVRPVDAILVLNKLAPYLQRQPLSIERLQKRHPLLLGSMSHDALDQRISRFMRRLKARGAAALPKRRSPSLLRFVTELEKETEPS